MTSQLQQERDELREEVARLVASNEELSKELDEITKTVVRMQVAGQQQDTGDKKKSRFDRLVDRVKDSKDVAELQAENEVLSAQIVLHKSEATRLHAMEQNTTHLQAFIRDTQLELNKKTEELKELHANPDSLLGIVTNERDELRSEMAALQQSMKDMEADNAKKMQEMQTQHEENLTLDRRMQSRNMNVRDSKVSQMKETNEALTAKLEITKKKLDEEVARSEARHKDLQQKVLDCAAWKDQCEHMGSQLIKHEDTENNARNLSETLVDLEEQTRIEKEGRKKAEMQVSDMRAQMERLSSALAEHQLQHDEVENLRKSVKTQTAAVASLKEELRMGEDTMKNNQLGYDNMKKDLHAALKVVAERDALLETLQQHGKAEAETAMRGIVSEAVNAAIMQSEWCTELEERREEVRQLGVELAATRQKIIDVKGEHKIGTRKKDNLIKELQASLRNTSHNNLDEISQCTPERRGSHLLLPSPSASSFQDPMSLSVNSGQDVTLLQKEETALIHRVAALKEANWKLEEEKRNKLVTIKYLQEDNEKKSTIINHWLSGPAAEMLLKNKSKLSTPSKGGTWLSAIVPGSTGSTGASSTSMQSLIQDTLAENIKLHKKIETMEKRLKG